MIDSAERYEPTATLYDYQNTVEALRAHNIPENDIALVGDVVVRWDTRVTGWDNVEDIQKALVGLNPYKDSDNDAKKLLEHAAQVIADDHWQQATQLQAAANEIVQARPGLFQIYDPESGQRFALESILMTGDHTHRATLYVTGDGETTAAHYRVKVSVDSTKLTPEERRAVDTYAKKMQFSPHSSSKD